VTVSVKFTRLVWDVEMGNMSYCRFENTVRDLQDCYDNFDLNESASEHEQRARKRMIKLCVEIAIDYGCEIDIEVEEVA